MFPPCLGDVFFKATVLAQQSGASDINIDILLAALDASQVDPGSPFLIVWISTESGGYAFSINNSDWTPVSTHAAKALGPFDGTENVDPATLRKALLAAK
jgi:hypothetical protein